jgi:hypothetical protein
MIPLDQIEFVWKAGAGPARCSASSCVGLAEVVVQEEATPPGEIPSGWTRVKLEPDCQLPLHVRKTGIGKDMTFSLASVIDSTCVASQITGVFCSSTPERTKN